MRVKFWRRTLMATLKRVCPGSVFKVGLVTYAFIGLILGICVALFSMVAGSVGSLAGGQAASARALGFGMGLGAIIIFPILYGVIGGIFATIGAVIYNLVAGGGGTLGGDVN